MRFDGNWREVRARLGHRLAAPLLGTVVVASMLVIGAVHVPATLAIGALAFGCVVLVAPSRLPLRRVPLAVWVLAGVALFTALQAIPIPLGLLAAVAPHTADVWTRALYPLGEAPPLWASASLDPGASLVESVKWASYAAVFAAAAFVARRRGPTLGVTIVFASAVLAAATTIGHGLAGATHVFGIYEPSFRAARWNVGPLLNANNLSGYLNMGFMAGLGLTLGRKPPAPRWLLALGLVMVLGVSVVSASRAGLATLLMALVAFGILVGRDRSGPSLLRPRTARWTILGIVAGGAVLAVLGAPRGSVQAVLDKNRDKLEVLAWTRPMIDEHRWLGIGRGAFESVFPEYDVAAGNVIYAHAENFVMQWLAEWGIPATLLFFFGLAWALRPAVLSVGRRVLGASVYCGFLALVFHNLFDLALEVPAVCLAVACALGSVTAASSDRTEPRDALRSSGVAWPGLVAIIGAVLVLIGAAFFGHRSVREDKHDLTALYLASSPADDQARAAFTERLREAMLRHPAEPVFPRLGALMAWRSQKENPMPWLQRALERDMTNGRTHLLLAQVLVGRRARTQALLELRLAVEHDPTLAGRVAELAAQWSRSDEDLMRVVPDDVAGVEMLFALTRALPGQSNAGRRLRLLNEATRRVPTDVSARERVAREFIGASAVSPAVCGGKDACVRSADEAIAALKRFSSTYPVVAELEAESLLAKGQPKPALALLAEACPRAANSPACHQVWVRAALQSGSEEGKSRAAKSLLSATCMRRDRCASTATWLGDAMFNHQDWLGAASYYARAAREEPTEARWLKLADASSRAGSHALAVDALERVAKMRGGGDEGLRARISAERARGVLGRE